MTSVPEYNTTGITGTDSVLQLLQTVRSGDALEYKPDDSMPEAQPSPVPEGKSKTNAETPDSETFGSVSGESEPSTKKNGPEFEVSDFSSVPLPESDDVKIHDEVILTENSAEKPNVSIEKTDNSIAFFSFNYPEEEESQKRRRKDHYRIKYTRRLKSRVFPFILFGLAFIGFCLMICLWYTDGSANRIKTMIWPDYRPDDYVVPVITPFEDSGLHLDLNATVEVTIKFNRQTQNYTLMEGAKVEDVVNICGIILGEEDYTEPDGDTVLSAGDEIIVHKTQYVEHVITGINVPCTNIERHSPLLSKGKTRVISYGRDGEAEQLYRDKYFDGVKVGEELISETVTKEPVSGIIRVGDPTASLSYIDGSKYTDIQIVGGVPEQYERKISSGKCTSYSYPSGVYGGSGMYLFQGCVAVDPNSIPLGSLLYITSSDNSFVYGWAIAADSCTAAMYGINNVTVDCFLETYNDCLLFGAHWLDIYVVKQLHQSELSEYIAIDGMFKARIPE